MTQSNTNNHIHFNFFGNYPPLDCLDDLEIYSKLFHIDTDELATALETTAHYMMESEDRKLSHHETMVYGLARWILRDHYAINLALVMLSYAMKADRGESTDMAKNPFVGIGNTIVEWEAACRNFFFSLVDYEQSTGRPKPGDEFTYNDLKDVVNEWIINLSKETAGKL